MAEASVKKARSALAVVGHGLQTVPWLSHAIVSRILTARVESILTYGGELWSAAWKVGEPGVP